MDNWPTLGVSATGVLNGTRVEALRVDASLVKGTIVVSSTADNTVFVFANLSWIAGGVRLAANVQNDAKVVFARKSLRAVARAQALVLFARMTTDFGISAVTGGTRTVDSVIDRTAQRADAASVTRVTRVGATAFDASLVEWTMVIRTTTNNAFTSNANLSKTTSLVSFAFFVEYLTQLPRVSGVFGWTSAYGLVTGGQAFGVDSATTRDARVLATLINARFGEVAVAVTSTSEYAFGVFADLSLSTVVIGRTTRRNHALAKLTYLANRAIRVGLAWFSRISTFNLRIAEVARRASTFWSMVNGSAFGIETASASNQARVGTLASMTFLVQRTVFVSSTPNVAFIGFANMAQVTFVIRPTFDASDTTSVDTGFSHVTLVVSGAYIRYLLAFQYRVSGVAGLAGTQSFVYGGFTDGIDAAS